MYILYVIIIYKLYYITYIVSYIRLVDNGMGRIENILKVLMSDHSQPIDFINNYNNLLPEADFDTFKKVNFPYKEICSI